MTWARASSVHLRLLLWLLAALLAARLAVVSVRYVDAPSPGFVAHFTAARLLAEGAEVVRFYDNVWFEQQVARYEPTVRDIFWANPPTMSLLMRPLAGLEYRHARAVWITGSLLLVLGLALWLARALRLPGPWAPAFLCLTCSYAPLYENLRHAQVYAFVLACLALAWVGYRRVGRQETGAAFLGAPLGVLLATKTAALPVWALLLVQRRWRALGWGVGAALLLVLVSWPAIGPAPWARYAREVAALTDNPLLAVTAYQTQLGFFRHLFGMGGARIGEPLLRLPLLSSLLATGIGLSLLGVSMFVAHRSRGTDTVFAGFVLLGLMLSPVSLDYHYVIALLPIALLTAQLSREPLRPQRLLLLICGALLIAGDLPYRSPRLADGLWALFAYPRLYGALLLWAMSLRWALRGGRIPAGGRD